MKKKIKRKYGGSSNRVVIHHLNYQPPITIKIFRKEHFLVSRLSWFKPPISKGFIKCLRKWIDENKGQAITAEKGR